MRRSTLTKSFECPHQKRAPTDLLVLHRRRLMRVTSRNTSNITQSSDTEWTICVGIQLLDGVKSFEFIRCQPWALKRITLAPLFVASATKSTTPPPESIPTRGPQTTP